MTAFNEILCNISFDEVKTQNDEYFYLHRIPTTQGCAELIKIKKGFEYLPHTHEYTDTKFIITCGKGLIQLDNESHHYKTGDVFIVNRNVKHGFKVEEETVFLSIQTRPILDQTTGKIDIVY
ncbi:MAG: cupin domain-containing protein [Chitinophagales bacterium]